MASITAAQGSKAAIYLVTSWSLIILAYSSLLVYKFELRGKIRLFPYRRSGPGDRGWTIPSNVHG